MSDREDISDGFEPLDFGALGGLNGFDDRSPGEREADDRFAGDADPAALLAKITPRAVHSPDGTFTVLARDETEPAIEVTVVEFVDTPGLVGAFGAAIAQRARAISVVSLETEVAALRRFVEFLRQRELLHIKPRHITNELLDGYKSWLDALRTPPRSTGKKKTPQGAFPKKGGLKLSKRTKQSYMGYLLNHMRIIRQSRSMPFEVRHDLDLFRKNDWAKLGHRPVRTEILTRFQLKHLVRICRQEVVEITERLQRAWAITEGDADTSDLDHGNSGEGDAAVVDRPLILEVARLPSAIEGVPPRQRSLRALLGDRGDEFPRLMSLPAQEYEAALSLRYPSGRLLVPFILLFAIYYRFNPSVLLKLKKSDFSKQPSPHGPRLMARKFKNRAGKLQVASWPVTKDLHNPATMIDTIERWTALVRGHAPEGSENDLFLVRLQQGSGGGFAGDHPMRHYFLRFVRDHEATMGTPFTLKMIRPSVINLVHHLFDGDLLATAEAGQHQVQTMVDHYLSDGARKLNDEALVPAVHLMNGWLGSNGLVDGREDKRRGDRSAATPGFGCNDRYGSTMPGQRPQAFCTAYGMCGSCPLKELDVNSPHAFALVVKLRDAIRRSRTRMPAESWIARWSGILDDLECKVWWLFPEHVREAADLDIPDLPTVE